MSKPILFELRLHSRPSDASIFCTSGQTMVPSARWSHSSNSDLKDLWPTCGQPMLPNPAKRWFKSQRGSQNRNGAEGKAEPSQAPGAARAPKQCRDKGWNRKRTGNSSDMSAGGARLQSNVRTRLNERSRRDSRGTVGAGQHPGARLRRLSPAVAMVKTAEAWQRSQSGVGNWSWLDRTSAGSVFFQGVVNTVLVVIADVLADDTTKVFFVPRDDVVEDLAAATPIPSFGRSVLPW